MIHFSYISILLIATLLTGSVRSASSDSLTDISFDTIFASPAPRVTSLNAQQSGNRIFIQWQVESNQSADQFEIEKSTDGKNFTLAALVFGTDNEEKSNYWFYDRNQKQIFYYRIKIISKTGETTYSSVIKK